MKVLIRQFLGKNHSWSVVGWGIANSLIKQNHEVHLFSTDGIENIPLNLKSNLIGYVEENKPDKVFGKNPDNNYDCQISYTAMKNFYNYLSSGNKNRFGIWCYEWAGKNVLPNGFAKHYSSCDAICAPSNFAKQVFLDSGIPETSVKVIPHGISVDDYKDDSIIMNLPTNKKFKILANIAQNHLRKNIPGLLDAYGKAFTIDDDVCLILKAKDKQAKAPFEISLKECLSKFYSKYPRHAEIKILSGFIDNMAALYHSVDAVYSMSHCEGFYFPGLEGIAAGKLSIAPNWGGHLDFLNSSNSLLIEGKESRSNPNSMYWERKNNAIWFVPSIDDAADKLRYAYQNYEKLNGLVDSQRSKIYTDFSWTSVTEKFLGLCK